MNKVFIVAGFVTVGVISASGYVYTHRPQATTPQNQIDIVQPVNTVHVLKKSIACPYTYVSWNLGNFGDKKTDKAIEIMAEVLRTADIIAVQEVTAGKQFGAKAVAKLADTLSRKGAGWDYLISNPTAPVSPGVERYAFFRKKSTVSTNRDTAHLVQELADGVDREPYTATMFLNKDMKVQVYTIHTVPTAKGPINEVKALEQSEEIKNSGPAIFSGDFNLGKVSTDPTFEKLGFTGYINERTSLKMKLSGHEYLMKHYDNIYVRGIHVCSSGTINFVEQFFSPVTDESLKKAREVSDHLPVFITFGPQ